MSTTQSSRQWMVRMESHVYEENLEETFVAELRKEWTPDTFRSRLYIPLLGVGIHRYGTMLYGMRWSTY
jgi:hypothetical protein